MAFLDRKSLEAMGFKHLGKDVSLSDRASVYNPGGISIGDHSRIDDFVVLSAGAGGIEIGRNVHIAVFVAILGAGRVVVGDFVGLSGRTIVYSSNDDYSGEFLTNPTVPAEFLNVTTKDVVFGRHSLVGAGSIILPGVNLGEGARVGAMSLVREGDYEGFNIYAGVPAKLVRASSRRLLDLEREYLQR